MLTDPELYQTFNALLDPQPPGLRMRLHFRLRAGPLSPGFRQGGRRGASGASDAAARHEWALDHYPPDATCFEPFPLALPYVFPFFCETNASFTVEQEGYYRLDFQVDACDCIFVEYTQGLHVPGWWGEGWGEDLFLVTDEDPGHCPDFAGSPSMGRFWYHEIDAPGNLLMWADAVCCDLPVDVEPMSWDRLKALYR